ncbi:Peptidase C14, caspase catalytic subunit p20 [Trichormus variabilis ATCC 29413]|uniref:Peptidase C14, caspase catalytic subunit p20 n=2 Tax=Anabaena variabilis TaxID=264691 RepID=Q3M719_TRIV2|nr:MULTISPECIES: caspase family protein [Nostocaceae]ABA23217.1 Peptidase C14, caspase catalytic subunit p20 [Trichormus variabilis ATCC 29413]MBC1212798.1 caspase family protein [Trichormus variabilis ARAD]MBC1254810.1 caspase family protein [Trichormus variabilis V5]MBC1266150.1 caspase family protein [Trichormus variabilis FSR]MBC1301450.1 caspase family protein [Trichormus variabilis N2B]
MANYWAIAIGVNQYQLFQPLRCAQADAEALKDFLVHQAGFVNQRCLLMTDTSPPIDDRDTYPTKENILLLLEDLAAACWQPEDHLWFFFSGYGVNYNGRDYLMPTEGDPKLVEETGIEVRSLMQSLQLANLNVLLLFDINRASASFGDTPVGKEIIELAEELQLATILSCQPDQFSQESRELGHGIFTGALLSALRSGYGSNLGELEKYLSVLTPELSQHYWRPTQNPVAFIPFDEQEILPPVATTNNPEVELSAAVPSTLEPSEAEPLIFSEESFAVALTAPSLGEPPRTTSKPPKFGKWEDSPKFETNGNGKSPTITLDRQPFPINTDFPQPYQPPIPDEEETGGRFIPNAPQAYISRLPSNKPEPPLWRQFLLWGGGTMVVVALISIILLRNQARVLRARQQLPTATSDSQIIKTPSTPRPVAKLAPLNRPKNQSTAQIAPISESKKRNQAVLDLAKMSLRQTQASDLSLAIATAKKIKPGEPLYEQAQENIKIWSRMILDLAEGRAKQRQYTNAIAAAKLIPKDEALYPQAQTTIAQWRSEAKQFLANQTLIDAANALIKQGQASTYNRAIEVAKRVPQGQPGFDLAQISINQWSQKILDLAKNRADQENFSAAIATATLVPEGTTVYEDAQEAIQKWEARKKSQ